LTKEILVGTKKPEFVAKSNESTNTAAPSATAEPTTNSTESIIKYKNFKISVPHEFNIVYLGIFLAIVLAFFSIYLMYRIYDLQTRTFSMHPYDFKLVSYLWIYLRF
jgi:cell division protein FtsL